MIKKVPKSKPSEIKEQKYHINQVGGKVLLEYTNSYYQFIQEIGNLEFFLMYILFAEHSDSKSFKENLITYFEKENENPVANNLIGFLKSTDSDSIFSSETYELYFGQMAYTRQTDNALSYFKDILSEIVRKQPNILKSSEKEPLDYILSFVTMDDLIDDLIEKKIKKLFYGSISDIKSFFLKRLGIELFENDSDENEFNLLVRQRNLIVHNRGIITDELANDFTEYKDLIGKKIHFEYKQLSTINMIINNIIVEIEIKLREKFDLDTMSAV